MVRWLHQLRSKGSDPPRAAFLSAPKVGIYAAVVAIVIVSLCMHTAHATEVDFQP